MIIKQHHLPASRVLCVKFCICVWTLICMIVFVFVIYMFVFVIPIFVFVRYIFVFIFEWSSTWQPMKSAESNYSASGSIQLSSNTTQIINANKLQMRTKNKCRQLIIIIMHLKKNCKWTFAVWDIYSINNWNKEMEIKQILKTYPPPGSQWTCNLYV